MTWRNRGQHIVRALAPLADLVYPPRCALCGAGIQRHGGLCASCWQGLAVPGAPGCSLCQRPVPDRVAEQGSAAALALAEAAEGSWICAPCMADPPRHAGIAAASIYNATSRQLVMGLKHGRRLGLADLMARLMRARIALPPGAWLVVPVPLHRWRLWRRGFNQSALLARALAQALDQPLVVDALLRPRATPPLGDHGRKARAALLAGAIRANPQRAQRLRGAQVLLVDDVLTSGATTDACMAALRRAGVQQVRIACFARVLDETGALAHGGMP